MPERPSRSTLGTLSGLVRDARPLRFVQVARFVEQHERVGEPPVTRWCASGSVLVAWAEDQSAATARWAELRAARLARRGYLCPQCGTPNLRSGDVGDALREHSLIACDECGLVLPRAAIAGVACPQCGHFACICGIVARHADDCRFRVAATGSVGIACNEHGRDTCPQCDPCTCGAGWGAGA